MGYTLRFAERVDLMNMVPESGLATSAYCLANKGKEYLVYVPEGREVVVDLEGCPGFYETEWFDPDSGESRKVESVEGGRKLSLTSPFESNRSVLYLRLE